MNLGLVLPEVGQTLLRLSSELLPCGDVFVGDEGGLSAQHIEIRVHSNSKV